MERFLRNILCLHTDFIVCFVIVISSCVVIKKASVMREVLDTFPLSGKALLLMCFYLDFFCGILQNVVVLLSLTIRGRYKWNSLPKSGF